MQPNNKGRLRELKTFLLTNRGTKQTLTKNTFWLSFGEIAGRILRLFIVVYAARVLGAAGWGAFSYLTSLAAVLTVFSDVGLSSVVIREASKRPELKEKYFSTAFSIKFLLTALGFLLIILVAPHVTKIDISKVLVYLVGVLFISDSLRRFGSSLFRVVERMELEALVNIITQAVIVVAGFAALLIIASPESLAAAYAIGTGAGLLVTGYILRKELRGAISSFDKKLLKPILGAAWPLSLAAIFGVLIVNIDTVIIGWFRSAAEVGFYAAAQKPIAFLYLLPALITGAFFPVLARLANKDNERFRYILEKGLGLVLLFAIPITIGIVLTAGEIVNLFYGSEYAPSAGPLRILALTLLAVFPVGMIINAIFAYNRQSELVPLWSIGLLIDIGLSLMLIPRWGITGAAWAVFITQLIINTLIWRKMKRINNFSVLKEMRLILLASFMMSVTIILARQINLPFLLVIPLAIGAYFGSLLWSDENIVSRIRETLKNTRHDFKSKETIGNNLP
ncbi:MAG: flippase [Candidatus Colwellbacteria bacterium]|nr:flippase [Candidatus Colwellbacteria bacterium]